LSKKDRNQDGSENQEPEEQLIDPNTNEPLPPSSDVISPEEQKEYDVARDADQDALAEHDKQEDEAEKADKEKHSRKPNDIRDGENREDAQKEVSASTLGMLNNFPHPHGPVHRIIGDNEYLLLEPKHIKELSEIAQEEITRLHGEHKYKVGEEEFVAVPLRTTNTPQPFAGAAGALSKESHDDIFAKNVQLDKERQGIYE
jgi:hypothetical protein